MGEGKRKSLSKGRRLERETRCIYCPRTNDVASRLTLEHMPTISMFRNRQRPSGFEFASCRACNNGTKGADVAATFMSLIPPGNEPSDWKTEKLDTLLGTLESSAPGFRDELVGRGHRTLWERSWRGVVEPLTILHPDGPIFRAYMDVFAAKFAMALYREHVGEPIPMDGAVYTTVFLNAGLATQQAEAIVSIMPSFGQLIQGQKTAAGQFDYRFNTDTRSIVAALGSFHGNLFILAFATSRPDLYSPSLDGRPHMVRTLPGELLERLRHLPDRPVTSSALKRSNGRSR